MGMPAKVEIEYIIAEDVCSKEVDKTILEIVKGFREEKEGCFDVFYDREKELVVCSSERYQNAKWQAEQVFEKLKCVNGIIELSSFIVMSESVDFWEKEESP
jgi:hypothetical protein